MSDKILSLINNNSICQIVSSDNKLFEIPKLLVENGKRVFVCIDDHIPVDLLSKYLQNLNPKVLIGYADKNAVSYNMATQIIYTTLYYMKDKLFAHLWRKRPFTFADVVIIDQSVTNNLDMMAIISLWLHIHKNNYQFNHQNFIIPCNNCL